MPLNPDGETYNRLLDATERANLQRYLAAHPDVSDGDVMPTLAGYAPVQDWLDAGEPGSKLPATGAWKPCGAGRQALPGEFPVRREACQGNRAGAVAESVQPGAVPLAGGPWHLVRGLTGCQGPIGLAGFLATEGN